MAEFDRSKFAGCAKPAATGHSIRALTVGFNARRSGTGLSTPERDVLALSGLEEISETTLTVLNPQLIVSPLVAETFDCMDLAALLFQFGYREAYRAISRTLPNPDIVRREVRSQCPGLDFDIVMLRPGESCWPLLTSFDTDWD